MLDKFAGNEDIKDAIRSVVNSGRFPHAVIIDGEEGSGRHTLARILAAAAVCEGENAPCGKCRACMLSVNDEHCDILTYEPDGAMFKVDAVREIRNSAYIMPVEAKRRVSILLGCEKMNESAQNAFLKVLEEPPGYAVFILVTTSASALLPTVRSRCVTFTVNNPDESESAAYIAKETAKPQQDILDALGASHGNIGKALKILDGEANDAAKKAGEYLDAVAARDRLKALSVLYEFEKNRPGFNAFLAELHLKICREMRRYSLKETTALRPAVLSLLLEKVTKAEDAIRCHIGQPLSLPLLQTALTAEIFSRL